MAPGKKLERKLKNAIRSLRLSADLHNSTKNEEETSVDFDLWFRTSVVSSYSHRIPQTIQYLCEALEIEDPWVSYLL